MGRVKDLYTEQMEMNNFIMFVGLPGSGKTTFIQENEKAITATYGVDCVVSSDAVIEDVAQSRGLTYSQVWKDSIKLASKYIEAMLGILSLQQRNFILDQTCLTKKSRQHKLSLLTHPANYVKIAVVFDTPYNEIVDRLHVRNSSGKSITTELLSSMQNSYVAPTLEEGFNKIMTVAEFKDSLKPPVYGEMKFA